MTTTLWIFDIMLFSQSNPGSFKNLNNGTADFGVVQNKPIEGSSIKVNIIILKTICGNYNYCLLFQPFYSVQKIHFCS
jgi:hypothetical protein